MTGVSVHAVDTAVLGPGARVAMTSIDALGAVETPEAVRAWAGVVVLTQGTGAVGAVGMGTRIVKLLTVPPRVERRIFGT